MIVDAYYADDLALLTNTPSQAKSLLHSPEKAVRGISLYVNVNKTAYKEKRAISLSKASL